MSTSLVDITSNALETKGDIKDEESVPAFKGGFDGPFLELIPDGRPINIPKYILTKVSQVVYCTVHCLEIHWSDFQVYVSNTTRLIAVAFQLARQEVAWYSYHAYCTTVIVLH